MHPAYRPYMHGKVYADHGFNHLSIKKIVGEWSKKKNKKKTENKKKQQPKGKKEKKV